MVSTRKKKHQNKKFLLQLKESLNDCFIDNNTHGGVAEDKNVGPQSKHFVKNFENATLCENSGSQSQVFENNFANRVRKEVDSVVVENLDHTAILTAMSSVVKPGVEKEMISITVSSGRGPKYVVQKLDQRLSGNTESTPLMTAFSRNCTTF